MNIKLRIQGTICGHLIGDAIGTEFLQNPSRKPSAALTSQLLARNYSYASAMTLCTMSSINDFGDIDLDDMANRFYEWYIGAYLSPPSTTDSRVAISQAIRMFTNGMPPDRCGSNTRFCDNTALIRVLPIALWNLSESTNKLIEDAHQVSTFTNPQIESKVCCALYCLSIRQILLEETGEKVSLELEKYYNMNKMKMYTTILERIRKKKSTGPQGTSEVIDSLLSSLEAFRNNTKNYENVMTQAIKFGYDCNTIACLAGSLSGGYLGINSIPQRWLNQINFSEEAKQVINCFTNLVLNRLIYT